MSKLPRLLTQNSELRKVGVYNFSLPAHIIKLSDGQRFNVCPNAGSCGRVCYAKFGTYNFPSVKAKHLANLEFVLNDPDAWQEQMINEVTHKRMNPTFQPHDLPYDTNDVWLNEWVNNGGKAVRIHDAGDFFDERYFQRWTYIAFRAPNVLFYAYTKEISMMLRYLHRLPNNFRIIFSYGGKQDHLIDRNLHRNADVFPTLEALQQAGYFDQSDNDLLAVVAPTNKIGIVANRLPVAVKRFAGRTMSEL
jgi:hypothetical protein